MKTFAILAGAAALCAPVLAQTFTACDPLNATQCPVIPKNPAFGLKDHLFDFNTSRTLTDSFNITNGIINYGLNGAEFTVSKRLESPTIQSKFYIFFGTVSVIMKAAPGQGIISSIVLQSEDLDEIDWEFMGGFPVVAQSNYFGKGNTTSFDRAVYHNATSDVHDNFHNYTVDWSSEKMDFYIDSLKVRTLMYGDANGGKNYPQTPCTVRLGIWAGGDESNNNGTIEWAGGPTDYTKGPYTMYVKSATISDASSGKEYEWTDRTGSFQSIKAIQGNSTVAESIAKTQEEIAHPPQSLSQKFAALPSTTKIGIYGGAGAAGAILLSAFIFMCIKQRRAGAKERDAYNAKVEKEREEAYAEQTAMREKGLGGFVSYETKGEDALGGWGGQPTRASQMPPPVPALPNVAALSNNTRTGSPAPTIPRGDSPGAVSPHSPRQWNGGNNGGMIHDAHNAYSGGYSQGNMNRTDSFASQATSFPSQGPQAGYTGGYGQSQSAYQRF